MSPTARAVLEKGGQLSYVGQLFVKFPDGTVVDDRTRQELQGYIQYVQGIANQVAAAGYSAIFKMHNFNIEGANAIPMA